MRSIYYAAPFFNPREFGVMNEVAKMVEPRKDRLKVFFPYMISEEFQRSLDNPSHRREIFQRNEQGIRDSGELLAWVDRLQMEDQQVQLCRCVQEMGSDVEGRRVDEEWIGNGKELRQPDLGTVWEMGFAHALGKTVVMFTLQDRKEAKLNLMLTESASLVLYGWNELAEYLDIPRPEQVMPFIRRKFQLWQGAVE